MPVIRGRLGLVLQHEEVFPPAPKLDNCGPTFDRNYADVATPETGCGGSSKTARFTRNLTVGKRCTIRNMVDSLARRSRYLPCSSHGRDSVLPCFWWCCEAQAGMLIRGIPILLCWTGQITPFFGTKPSKAREPGAPTAAKPLTL